MSLVRPVLPSAYAAKARGLVLCAVTIGAAYVYYLAVDADDAIPPAAADSVVIPPVVKAEAINAPIHVIPSGEAREAIVTPNRVKVARELQSALARAHCYDGPITGKWTSASRDAMRAFLVAVNSELPVGDPDPTLLALVSSNEGAVCSSNLPLYTGALNAQSLPPSRSNEQRQVMASTTDERSMLDRPWAPPDMLVATKDEAVRTPHSAAPMTVSAADPLVEPDRPTVAVASVGTSDLPLPPAVQPVKSIHSAGSPSDLHFETGNVISEAKPDPVAHPLQPEKAVQQKPKARVAKRKKLHHDDSSLEASFNSLQRSLASIFD